MLGITMIGCSSTGRFVTGDTEKDYKWITTFQPEWKSTGDRDADTLGAAYVMSLASQKRELDAVIAKLWAEQDLNKLIRSSKAHLQSNGIEWIQLQRKRSRSRT